MGGTTFSAAASRSRLASGISGIASTTSSTPSGPSRSVTVRSRPLRACDFFGGDVLAPAEPVDDAGPGPSGGTDVGLDHHDFAARLQQHLGDPRPHGAAADHGRPAASSALRHGVDPTSGAGGRQNTARRPAAPPPPAIRPMRKPVIDGCFEDSGCVIQRPLPRPEAGDAQAEGRERHDVLVALAGPEDEEPVLQVVRDPGDQHHADDAGAGQRREEADDAAGRRRRSR